MSASTTQQTVNNPTDNPLAKDAAILQVPGLEKVELNKYIQEKYAACWGTLKFEDSLSDYSNDVNRLFSFFFKFYKLEFLGSTISLC
jgi:hypothetical protein